MMITIVRSLLRSRLPLPLLPLGSALVIRAGHSGRVDWLNSDLQGVLAALEYLVVIPMLSIVLATGWLRGEVGPWSWALARPIARARWLGVTLLVDALTLAGCVLAAHAVIGELPMRWIGPWQGDAQRALGYASLLAVVHCAAAFAGARGASAIGGGLSAMIFVGAAALTRALAEVVWIVTRALTLRMDLTHTRLLRGLGFYGPSIRFDENPMPELVALALVMFFACASIIAVLHTARQLPLRPRVSLAVRALGFVVVVFGVLAPIVAFRAAPDLYPF